jgi:hypothetical protein
LPKKEANEALAGLFVLLAGHGMDVQAAAERKRADVNKAAADTASLNLSADEIQIVALEKPEKFNPFAADKQELSEREYGEKYAPSVPGL